MADHISTDLHSRNPRIQDNKPILDSRILEKKTVQQTDSVANYLVEKYNSPAYRPIFLKAAWRLTEQRIMEIVEASMAAPVPRAYFIKSVKNERDYKG